MLVDQPRADGTVQRVGVDRARTRRTVASVGGRKAPVNGSRRTPKAASTWPGVSLAHSPIAVRDLAPASTAATATASTATSMCRRPRRWRGSLIWARWSSRLRHWSGASAAGTASRWAIAAMGDDEQAGTAVRSGHGLRHHMIAGNRACSTSTRTTHPNATNQSSPHYAETLTYRPSFHRYSGQPIECLDVGSRGRHLPGEAEMPAPGLPG